MLSKNSVYVTYWINSFRIDFVRRSGMLANLTNCTTLWCRHRFVSLTSSTQNSSVILRAISHIHLFICSTPFATVTSSAAAELWTNNMLTNSILSSLSISLPDRIIPKLSEWVVSADRLTLHFWHPHFWHSCLQQTLTADNINFFKACPYKRLCCRQG